LFSFILIFNYLRQVSESVGVGEILSSPSMVEIEPYIVINRRVCSKCARNVAMLASLDPNICHDCHHSTVKIYRDITDENFENYPLKEANSGQCAKTLLFLCARKSGNNWKIKEDYFEKLFKAVNRRGWCIKLL
jgi:hypothetical protein